MYDIENLSEPIKKTYKILKKKSELKPNLDEEMIELNDLSQFKVVSHNSFSDLDNLYENFITNIDFSRFTCKF